MKFLRFLIGWWGAAEQVIPPTPSDRTFIVVSEDRVFTVDAENRSFTA